MQLLSLLYVVSFGLLTLASKEPPTELQIESAYIPGECSTKAASGDKIKVHYTGTLFSNGNKFDSSYDRGTPLPLTLGAGQVIKGWDEGLQGMCVGEKRVLTIPADKAYGSRGFGNVIPPNSVLVFDVELTNLESKQKSKEEL